MAGALGIDRSEGLEVLAGPTEQRRRVDGGVRAPGRGSHIVGTGDVAGHDVDAHGRQRAGVGHGSTEGAHLVASRHEDAAYVGAEKPGGAGDEDRLAHDGAGSGSVSISVPVSVRGRRDVSTSEGS